MTKEEMIKIEIAELDYRISSMKYQRRNKNDKKIIEEFMQRRDSLREMLLVEQKKPSTQAGNW